MGRQILCSECGSPLPPDAPEGLCPHCLLGLSMTTDSTQGSISTVITKGSTPTLLEQTRYQESSRKIDIREVPGRYSHPREHSRGGMGRILLVHDQTIGRDVALKELLPELESGSGNPAVQQSTEMVARFLREAQLTGQLEHPSIVPVYEMGRRHDGRFYYTMKLVRGKTLDDVLSEKKTLSERLKLLPHVVNLCQAIAYAHSRGVIHRDLKPSNIMVGEFGETVVIDWGLAKTRNEKRETAHSDEASQHNKITADNVAACHTRDGTVMGTPMYMPPEQASGDLKHVDERSDVYSLGAVLYEVLTGAPPFTGTSARNVLEKVLAERPTPMLQIERHIPPELASICERAMAHNPKDRHASAKELADDIQAFIIGRVFQGRTARISFLAAIYGLGVFLIAAGIITLVAYNWKRIPANGQAALIVTTMFALLGSGFYFWKISTRRPQLGHLLIFMGVLMFGIDIFLLCKIYHFPVNWNIARFGASTSGGISETFLLLLWAFCAYIVALAVRSKPIIIVSLFLSFLWFCDEFDGFAVPHPHLVPQIYLYPLAAAILFLPVCYAWGTSRTFTFNILAITISSLCIAGYYESMCCILWTFLAAAMALFPLGLLTYSGTQREKIGEPALGLGLVALSILVAFISSWHAHILFIDAYRNQIADETQYLLQYIPIILFCSIATVLWGFTAMRHTGVKELRILIWAFVAVMLIEVGLLAAGMAFAPESQPNLYPQEARVIIFAIANASVFILGAAVAWTGVLFLNRRIFWVGTLFVAGMAIWRIFELDMDFQLRASILVCVGAGLIAIGICLESYLTKRSLV